MAVRLTACCKRCGSEAICKHGLTFTAVLPSYLADKIRLYWTIGQHANPDHDTTSYYDMAMEHFREDDPTVP